MAKCFAARNWSDLTKNCVFQFALADKSRVPTNEELESILKFRSEGHFSDKNSDFLDPLRQKRPRLRTLRASEARRQAELQSEEEEEEEGVRLLMQEAEQMLGDDPYASGQIFSLGGFSQEVSNRKSQVKRGKEGSSSSGEISSIERGYRLKPYIQLYNKLSKLQVEVKMGGSVRVTNAVITKNCK